MEHSFIPSHQCGHSFRRLMRLKRFFPQIEHLKRRVANMQLEWLHEIHNYILT